MKFWQQIVKLKDRYLVVSLIVLGLLLRIPLLRLGLFRDEASTYFNALPPTLDEVIKTVILCELNPPGFYLIMHQWMRWFGSQEIVFKIPTLIFGLLLIPATYRLGRVTGSRTTGLLAALFVTLAPAAVFYSHEARPYNLAALLSCLSILLYCRVLTSNSKSPLQPSLLGFVLCTSLLIYVHYTGLLLFGSLATVTALFWLRRRKLNVRIVPLIFAFAVIFLLFLPWLPNFLIHLSTDVPWEERIPLWKLPNQFISHLKYTVPLVRILQQPVSFLIVLVLGVRMTQFFSGSKRIFKLPSLSHDLSIVTLEFSLVILTILEAFLVSNGSRYMFPFFPIAWVVYSYWIIALFSYVNSRLKRSPENYPIYSVFKLVIVFCFLGGLVFANLISAMYWGYQAQQNPKSGMRPLIADVKKSNWEKTIFLVAPNPLAPSFGYYSAQAGVSPSVYGFPSWDRPELFKVQDYVQGLQDPTAITVAEKRIRAKFRQGYSELALVTPSRKQDNQTERLLARLKLTYRLILTKNYSGREPITLYLFQRN